MDRWGLQVTVVASFAVHVSAAGSVHACALRLIPLAPQTPPLSSQAAEPRHGAPVTSTFSCQYAGG
jgi:hypothetical protein